MYSKTISEEILDKRLSTGLTQENFAKLLNVVEPLEIRLSRHQIGLYERGKVMPPADKYRKIMKFKLKKGKV